MIKDLFSHKIHSSHEDWSDKLIELAFLFAEFDGTPYDRDAIEDRLRSISPRSVHVARDPSKLRDEYGAYPAYFGLYHLELKNGKWYIRLSETAKKFLIREEPDAAAFLRIQLSLFQYPNGMGAVYMPPNKIRIQANIRDRTVEFIREGIHLSPLRLITSALVADAHIGEYSIFDASVSYAEVMALVNDGSLNCAALPHFEEVVRVLSKIRKGEIPLPSEFERRFHLLQHLEMFDLSRQGIRFRSPSDPNDQFVLESRINAILSITSQFSLFDAVTNASELLDKIKQGTWGKYFDGVLTLNSQVIEDLSSESVTYFSAPTTPSISLFPPPTATTYPIKVRDTSGISSTPYSGQRKPPVDPEVTRIKRQRRNLAHKLLVDQMDEVLRQLGADPKENAHIDLLAEIPSDGSFIFEMKSGGESLLDQVRKGVSQLYEYRFRYRDVLNPDVKLCLVLPYDPVEVAWLHEYLCLDRGLCVCWFNGDGSIGAPNYCAADLAILGAS